MCNKSQKIVLYYSLSFKNSLLSQPLLYGCVDARPISSVPRRLFPYTNLTESNASGPWPCPCTNLPESKVGLSESKPRPNESKPAI